MFYSGSRGEPFFSETEVLVSFDDRKIERWCSAAKMRHRRKQDTENDYSAWYNGLGKV